MAEMQTRFGLSCASSQPAREGRDGAIPAHAMNGHHLTERVVSYYHAIRSSVRFQVVIFHSPGFRLSHQSSVESDIMLLDETLAIMRTTDRIREQWQLTYPMA